MRREPLVIKKLIYFLIIIFYRIIKETLSLSLCENFTASKIILKRIN